MTETAAIVLAAGQGKRMKSDLPKVLHEVGGRPMVERVLDTARAAGAERIVVVVGYEADLVRERLRAQPGVEFALQEEQLGTGHAVKVCSEALAGFDGPVLVLAGDTPLLRPESLRRLTEELQRSSAACVVGTAVTENNAGLGRIVRDADGEFLRIVEEKDATAEERAITEVNTGCYAFEAPAMFRALQDVSQSNEQDEYYLTDCVEILRSQGRRVLAVPGFEIDEAMGVNTPEQLEAVSRVLRDRAG